MATVPSRGTCCFTSRAACSLPRSGWHPTRRCQRSLSCLSRAVFQRQPRPRPSDGLMSSQRVCSCSLTTAGSTIA
eukprot:2674363-Prymnesium_polylepis.1